MAGTLEDPKTQEVAPPVTPVEEQAVVVPDDASRLCVNCAALLEEGQDWCLECGTAQPGRITGRPGWRAALVVVAVVGLLAAGAVAAGYAALSSDAERQASAPPPPDAQAVVPPAPAPVAPPPAAEEETPPVAAPENDTEADAPAASSDTGSDSFDSGGSGAATPDAGATDTDSFDDGDTSGGSNGAGSGGYTEDEAETETKPKPVNPVIALGPDAASTFDPYDRAGGLTGDPADAIDGRSKTAWEAPVAVADGKVNIGLLVSLDEAKAIDKVRLQAGTPGFTVELYGSKLGTPPDGAPGATKYWTKLDATRDFGTDEMLTVGGGKFRHVLLWFTDQPADTKVMIPDVQLRKPVE
jgi:RNA polymerase subunit RPABC4/transcription elongation factor Spt4